MSLGIGFCVAVLMAGAQPAAPQAARHASTKATGVTPPIDLVWMVAPLHEALASLPRPPDTGALRVRGTRIFTKHCAVCHGKRGDGAGPAAPTLSVKSSDLTKAVFKVRSTPSGTLPTDADLFGTISRGLHGTEMFPWSRFSESDRWALVQRVKLFSARFKFEEQGLPFTVPSPPPAETDALRAKGKALYGRLGCGTCHGIEGGADGPAVQVYKDQKSVRRVYIRDFKKGQFLRGSEMQDIYMTLLTGLDGTPMGAYGDLPAADLWALAGHVRDLVQRRPMPAVVPSSQ